jgi:TldD protein
LAHDIGFWVDKVLSLAKDLNVDFADVRAQEYRYELIVVDNGRLKEYSKTIRTGIGVRVVVNGFQGYSYTSILDEASIREAVESAVKIAKASSGSERVELAEYSFHRDRAVSGFSRDPIEVDPSEKLKLALDVNDSSREVQGISSSITRLGVQADYRLVANTQGGWVEVESRLLGVAQTSAAQEAGSLEIVTDSSSRVSGWEFVESRWDEIVNMATRVSKLAKEAVRARHPKAGVYTVVLEPEVVGLFLHEALGHASEGDLVYSDSSVLKGRIGQRIAPEFVTIVDDGLVEGGYYVPYDDEGVRKTKTVVVENGVLKHFLTSRETAAKLGQSPTGNARVMDYSQPLLVRQTNYYMLPGDYDLDELLEDVKLGIYVTHKGARGGEVDPAAGTFTFNVGVSWLIENGERKELLRGVSLSGSILEMLANIDALGKELKVTTSVFGGCGKSGQLVRVGDGGPYTRVKGLTVGGV